MATQAKSKADTASKSKSTASKSKTSDSKKSATSKTSAAGKVKAKSSAAEDLRELMVDGLKDIYWAEKALTKALPKMAKNATTEELKRAMEDHLTVTEDQVKKVEQVFEILGEKAKAEKCDAMDGLIKEGEDIMKSTKAGPVRDAGIIAAAQKVEHYEIASYGTLCAWAETLGENKALKILKEILGEEKDADVTLTEAAYGKINFDAK
ncbi:ferritin-like domain-containing protein [Aequorivita sp. SDUM287046]|uniref:Ferritin-like domain-containing protein n=1 Tax=Aequorivita aurantiaca TaxID=3053356 RepID=A0ABT8DQ86_9FLAO|nr:ferritin-like domain-containing protein [Aequorivita aurantiaca]MDN3725408.1 ferritin-like domain-containing protein [Aequorivita aurantiaca]